MCLCAQGQVERAFLRAPLTRPPLSLLPLPPQVVHVRAVKLDARTLSLMVPCGVPLPGRFLLLGSSTWHET